MKTWSKTEYPRNFVTDIGNMQKHRKLTEHDETNCSRMRLLCEQQTVKDHRFQINSKQQYEIETPANKHFL